MAAESSVTTDPLDESDHKSLQLQTGFVSFLFFFAGYDFLNVTYSGQFKYSIVFNSP